MDKANITVNEMAAADGETLPVELLSWDSDFFGFTVAKVCCNRLERRMLEEVFSFCDREKVRLLQFICDAHHRPSVLLSEEFGFHFADIRLTFDRPLDRQIKRPTVPEGLTLRLGQVGDIPRLREMAGGLYETSRYFFDTNFPRDKVKEFYQDWAAKAVLGTFDDFACLICSEEMPVGYCTVRIEPEGLGRIRLVGVDQQYSSRGLGSAVIQYGMSEMVKRGVHHLEVVTQGRNYEAQRLYQRAGCVTQKAELWYHRWFER